ncbi:hypothetical protein ACTFIZ_009916 [Dictyostelium cf. discoideum]
MEENKTTKPHLVFIFVGQGSFRNKIPLELFENENNFKSSITEIDNIFNEKYYGYSMLDKYKNLKENDRESFLEQHFIHCISFMFQVSIFKLYKYYGVEPDQIVGMSLGEIASAYCSGLIDLETACFISHKRACLMTKLESKTLKKIISIRKPEDFYWDIIKPIFPSIEINGCICYDSTMVAGDENEINQLLCYLKKNEIQFGIIESLINFHTSDIDQVENDFKQLTFQSFEPEIPNISCSTAKFYNKKTQDFNPESLFNIARSSVSLSKATKKIYETNSSLIENRPIVFVEISAFIFSLISVEKDIKKLSKENNDNRNHQFFPIISQDFKTNFLKSNYWLIKTFGNK